MMDINHHPTQADQNAQQLIRRTKQITRRRFTPEEKVRILIEGIRGEIPVSRGTASEKPTELRWRPSSKRTSGSRNWWPSCLWRTWC
jgi:hypothetical protein